MKFDDLTDIIRLWESDTFSSTRSEITEREARLVAEDLFNLLEDHIDGHHIHLRLCEIRADDEDHRRDESEGN